MPFASNQINEALSFLNENDFEAELARRNLIDFVKLTDINFREFPFHTKLFQRLEKFEADVEAGRSPKLFIALPPRNYKTETAIRFVARAMGRHPQWQFMFIGHDATLAERSSRRSQELLREYGKRIFNLSVKQDVESRREWENEKGGICKAVGAMGSVTGSGFNVLVLDDPIKGVKQAMSRQFRNNQYEWYRSEIETRRQLFPRPLHGTLFIMARWHKDDLIGKLLQEDGDEWDQFVLPAYDEKTNEWLEPELEKELAEVKERGGWVWRALYQQKPTEEEGNIFKRHWWRFYDKLPDEFDEVVQSWDMAFKSKETSDFVCGGVWGRLGADFYLLHLINRRLTFTESLKAIEDMTKLYPQSYKKLVEDKANGTAVIDTLKHKISGLIEVNPEGGKEARAYACSPIIESGNVYLPEQAEWLNDFLDQTSDFPNSDNDDMVDMMTQFLNNSLKNGEDFNFGVLKRG